MAQNESQEIRWYVVHTYSGYENKVKDNLLKTVENRNYQHLIPEVVVPLEEVTEIKDNKRRKVSRKIFPGYVLVRMLMTDETWYIVRNTRGVTGFVGPGSRPIPLTETEVASMLSQTQGVALDFEVGDRVKITEGSLEDLEGTLIAIDSFEQKVRVAIMMFGRETTAELDVSQIAKLDA